jgi:hypothetical protein
MVMMKKLGCAGGLLALLLVVGMAEAEAQSSGGFPCQIDLGERETDENGDFLIDPDGLVIPDELRTTYGQSSQNKVCQVGRRDIRLSCDAFIKDWPFNQRLVTSTPTCCINAASCGIDNNVGEGETPPCGSLTEAGTVSLRIIATQSSLCGPDSESCGMARLECRLR